MTRTRALVVLFLALVFVTADAQAARRRPFGLSDTIIVGGLFSLSGDGATLGKASAAALDLAVHDINAEMAELQLPYRVHAVVKDTRLTPQGAIDGINELHAAGATVIIGPQSSAEAAAIREFANEHRILLISQASTAFSLAIPGDYLFRLAPNDRLEGAAVAALLKADAVDVVVPLWRADAGQTGLKDGVVQFFTQGGGVATAGVSYSPATTDFTAAVNSLGDAVRAAKTAHPGKRVAVYLAAFEEGAQILGRARLDSDLAVNWYSGDGLTQSQALLSDPAVAAFAAATKFNAPAVALSEQTRELWEPLSAAIAQTVGFPADAFSLSVYDAAWVSALSAIQVGNRADLRLQALTRNLQRYWGVTGSLAVDAAGDRKAADFDFWTVKETGTRIDWVRTASYASGRLVR